MQKLIVRNLHKEFDGQVTLQDISFTASSKEAVALLGRSGSGKTTLLRCLNYLESTDKGSINLNDLQLNNATVKKWRSLVGMIFQQYHLWPHMTVLKNLILAPLRVLNISKATAIQQAYKWLDRFHITDKANSYPGSLSGGQQQRVAIARALMMQPKVLLMDEPIAALDPHMINEIQEVIEGLCQEGYLVIFSSHNTNFVKNVATKVLFLHNGKLIEQGPTSQLYNNPATTELKNFLAME